MKRDHRGKTMEVICTGCSRRYKVDDSKIPPGGVAYLACPNCKEKIEVRSKVKEKAGRRQDPVDNASTDMRASSGFEFFEPGTKTALVYCPQLEARDEIIKGLSSMDFEARMVSNVEDVRSRLRYHQYDLVVLYQQGPDPDKYLTEILGYFNSLPMEVRRYIFLVYIYLSGNRFDSMQSFSLGVDMTLGPLDVASLPKLLYEGLDSRDAAYRIFFECKDKVDEEIH